MTDVFPAHAGPIGVFDSGYGGLTILQDMRKALPSYDFLYLGDNARAPYGPRSYEVVYEFTKQAVHKLFSMGCHLVILACNTASAKALRTIQQQDLPGWDPQRRVLGIIRPTAECVGRLSTTKHVGILATTGTILSESYPIEIRKVSPEVVVVGEACPMWVPLVENSEHESDGADYFVRQHIMNLLNKDPLIDTVILGCTHYPLLLPKIRKYVPQHVKVLPQGTYVADSLKDYLQRHPELDACCLKNAVTTFFTTEHPENFIDKASVFLNADIRADRLVL